MVSLQGQNGGHDAAQFGHGIGGDRVCPVGDVLIGASRTNMRQFVMQRHRDIAQRGGTKPRAATFAGFAMTSGRLRLNACIASRQDRVAVGRIERLDPVGDGVQRRCDGRRGCQICIQSCSHRHVRGHGPLYRRAPYVRPELSLGDGRADRAADQNPAARMVAGHPAHGGRTPPARVRKLSQHIVTNCRDLRQLIQRNANAVVRGN